MVSSLHLYLFIILSCRVYTVYCIVVAEKYQGKYKTLSGKMVVTASRTSHSAPPLSQLVAVSRPANISSPLLCHLPTHGNMRLLLVLQVLATLLRLSHQHVSLTFPPARDLNLDFLDNIR